VAPRLKIQNETQHDGRQVSGVIRWVFRELDLVGTRVVVKVKHHNGSHAYQGRFYPRAHAHGGYIWNDRAGEYVEVAPKIPYDCDHLLVCRIAKSGYPIETHVYDREDSPGTWEVSDWREALVCITAHEAMHLRQYLTKKKGRGRFNEVETEWAAHRLWKRWRDR
jgi:hypothetical protein